MEFDRPLRDKSYYISKFYVAGDRVFVTEPGDIKTQHTALIEEAEVTLRDSGQLEAMSNKAQQDAGFLKVTNNDDGTGSIILDRYSSSLDLPRERFAEEARAHSVTAFQRLSPGYEVTGEPPYKK